MHAGFGLREINAPPGTVMDGLRACGGTSGVHDDLFARALYLKDGTTEGAIVSLDLLFAERETVERLKGAIGLALGLRADRVLINFSHTHSAPGFSRWLYGPKPDPAYVNIVERAIVASLLEARDSARPVRILAGMTQTALPLSRRRPNEKGRIEFRPNPRGEVCRALPFCLLRAEGGPVVSLLFSVSCHPSTVYSHDITADYPGAAIALLNGRLRTSGGLFLQGCGGDAKPCVSAIGEERWRHNDWSDVERAGAMVAEELMTALDRAREVTPCLAFQLMEVSFPLEPAPSRAELEAVADARRAGWAADMLQRLETKGELPKAVPIALHALRLGAGLRMIGLEAEPTAAIGNMMLRRFAEGVTFPLGCTNGAQIYLPSDAQLAEGGYEADSAWEYHWPSRLASGVDRLLESALDSLAQAGF